MKTCTICGDVLQGRQSKFCGPECTKIAKNNGRRNTTPKMCETCGNGFIGSRPKYCSPECLAAVQNKQQQVRYAKRPKRVVICDICEIEFKTSRKKQKTCSSECTAKSVAAANKRYREENHEQLKSYSKKYYEENKEKWKTPEYLENRKVYKKEYDARQDVKEARNLKRRQRMAVDPEYKLQNVLRARISNALKSKNARKVSKTTELLGCTIQEFRVYIESLWEDWMNWDNHGYDYDTCWHIDHIIPCASFDLTDPEQQKLCFHYTNLQPLKGWDNIDKSDNV